MVTADVRGDDEHVELMLDVAKRHGLMRIDAFRLIAPKPDYQCVADRVPDPRRRPAGSMRRRCHCTVATATVVSPGASVGTGYFATWLTPR